MPPGHTWNYHTAFDLVMKLKIEFLVNENMYQRENSTAVNWLQVRQGYTYTQTALLSWHLYISWGIYILHPKNEWNSSLIWSEFRVENVIFICNSVTSYILLRTHSAVRVAVLALCTEGFAVCFWNALPKRIWGRQNSYSWWELYRVAKKKKRHDRWGGAFLL